MEEGVEGVHHMVCKRIMKIINVNKHFTIDACTTVRLMGSFISMKLYQLEHVIHIDKLCHGD